MRSRLRESSHGSAGFGPDGRREIRSKWPDFHQGLKDLGYIEGQNVVVDYRFAEDQGDRIPDLVAELLELRPDVMVALGAVSAVRNATTTIAIVGLAGDPVGTGLVASLARPGGNITGVSMMQLSAVCRKPLPNFHYFPP
jgi:ABC-type uncharacterized transport system substrate-binding protein